MLGSLEKTLWRLEASLIIIFQYTTELCAVFIFAFVRINLKYWDDVIMVVDFKGLKDFTVRLILPVLYRTLSKTYLFAFLDNLLNIRFYGVVSQSLLHPGK